MKTIRKFFKGVVSAALCAGLAIGGYLYGPAVMNRLMGDQGIEWLSQRFSTTLREKNELVVYEVEISGEESVSQEAWLLGTVQRVQMPYTFTMCFVVDLSQAEVNASDRVVEVCIPSPKAAYPQLIVDEDNVKTVDWLYHLTPSRYAWIKQTTEEKLMKECAANETYQRSAWNQTVTNLETLFSEIAPQSLFTAAYELRIVEKPTLSAPISMENVA